MGKGLTGRRSLHRACPGLDPGTHGPDMEGRPPRSTCLQGRAKKAQAQPKHRCGTRYERLHEAYLRECWRDIRKDAASGVDHVSAEAYAQHLEENIHDLVERLKGKRYRATRVTRHSIPKGDGNAARSGDQPWKTRGCNARSRGYSKRSTRRTSCGVAMGIGPTSGRWTRWTRGRSRASSGGTTGGAKRICRASSTTHVDTPLKNARGGVSQP